jgi:hypothetical protein
MMSFALLAAIALLESQITNRVSAIEAIAFHLGI